MRAPHGCLQSRTCCMQAGRILAGTACMQAVLTHSGPEAASSSSMAVMATVLRGTIGVAVLRGTIGVVVLRGTIGVAAPLPLPEAPAVAGTHLWRRRCCQSGRWRLWRGFGSQQVRKLSGPNARTQTFHRRSWSVDGTDTGPPTRQFPCAHGFSTRQLMHMLDSLVRVSRRAH